MSRSRKKPFVPYCGKSSAQAQWKRQMRRKFRRTWDSKKYEGATRLREVSDLWNSPYDGTKHLFDDPSAYRK